MTADLIRWEDNGYGGFLGYVGTVESWLYQIWKPERSGDEWMLQPSSGAHFGYGKVSYGDSPDELKPQAEELLREFVSSLGAMFPAAADRPHVEAARRLLAEFGQGRLAVPASYSTERALYDCGRTLLGVLDKIAPRGDANG